MQPALKHKHGTRSQLLPSFVQQQLLGSWLWDKPQCLYRRHEASLLSHSDTKLQSSVQPCNFDITFNCAIYLSWHFLQHLYNMNALAVPATPIQTNKQTKKTLSMLKINLFTPDVRELAWFLAKQFKKYRYFWRKDQFQAKYMCTLCSDLIHSPLFWLKNSTCQKRIVCSFHPGRCFFIIFSCILHSC